ncbi:fasciclin domain-containing protein [Sphaerospermopsis sp. FACHB-1194]|uniref:fasciclin domain-containing protein n=1 Tax=Sphaerospermopsis sp. FACHB-1194 TaxID=2692862 RepID=UPI0016819302|nr:fasciclin domain-containing protein [Sphaerospermopsis sp. FACHB-1194]MBD2148450.1 fasciclin domain-containing protein [Sphaerospermopsis sp. FACHB-1194]
MKANYSKLLTNIAGILGVTGVNLLITLPSRAEVVPNHDANIKITTITTITTQIAQSSGDGVLNPRPSIFNEPPYNRGTAPSETPRVTPPTQTTETKNVVEVAESAGNFKTLIKALEAAGLKETLQGAGPFTILAPTDEAFAKLPQDAVQDLLKPENKEILVKILTYHVIPGRVLSSDLKSGEVTSLQGDPIKVLVNPSKGVSVNDAQVTKADIPASNGVIHQIDNLILPPSL